MKSFIEYFKKRILAVVLHRMPGILGYTSVKRNVITGKNVKIYEPSRMFDVSIGDYSYVSMYSHFKKVTIGKFCSIGPGCMFGWGLHPIDGVSTAPMFYSTRKQNGITLSETDKCIELKQIIIGNDVFIGMNVTILDGVTIGDGAVVGAGCVVSKNIPPYSVAVGNPVKVIKYRFDERTIAELLRIKWWDFNDTDLKLVESNFFSVEKFIEKAKNYQTHRN